MDSARLAAQPEGWRLTSELAQSTAAGCASGGAAVLEQAIRYDPDRPEGYIAWATIRVERDDVKGAFTLFELLTERLPDFAPGWVFRAQAEEALDRKAGALESVRRAEALSDEPELRELTTEIRQRLRGLG